MTTQVNIQLVLRVILTSSVSTREGSPNSLVHRGRGRLEGDQDLVMDLNHFTYHGIEMFAIVEGNDSDVQRR